MHVRQASVADLFASGRWLPPNAAAAALGITIGELRDRYHHGGIRRRSVGHGFYVYDVGSVRA